MSRSRWTYQSLGKTSRWAPPRHLGHRVERVRFLTWRRAIALAVVLGFGYAVCFSSLLNISEVTVQGNRAIPTESVTAAVARVEAGRRWLIFSERNIIFFGTADLTRSIDDVRLQDLSVGRRPWGRLLVTIREKSSSALWLVQNNWFAVDQTGTIIAPATTDAIQSATAIHVFSSTDSAGHGVGDKVVATDLLGAIEHINAGIGPTLGFTMTRYDVAAAGEGTVTAQTNEGWLIQFNTKLDIDTQLRKLAAFVADKNKENPVWRKTLKYIDVRFGNTRVYYQ